LSSSRTPRAENRRVKFLLIFCTRYLPLAVRHSLPPLFPLYRQISRKVTRVIMSSRSPRHRKGDSELLQRRKRRERNNEPETKRQTSGNAIRLLDAGVRYTQALAQAQDHSWRFIGSRQKAAHVHTFEHIIEAAHHCDSHARRNSGSKRTQAGRHRQRRERDSGTGT
jgi:hypothetical protein